ncbi:Uncharacterised protein [Dermacoccus nishinomiyaensis]|nr:Uncharacterised protein [Dermacoccus nishinomiyaensis]
MARRSAHAAAIKKAAQWAGVSDRQAQRWAKTADRDGNPMPLAKASPVVEKRRTAVQRGMGGARKVQADRMAAMRHFTIPGTVKVEIDTGGKASSIEDRTHITTTVPLDASEMETVAACIEAQEYEEAAATFNAALIDAWMGGTRPVNMKILHWTPVEPE